MRFQVRCTEDAVLHIARHGLLPEEVDEALLGRVYARRSGKLVAVTGRCTRGVIHVVLSPAPDRPKSFDVVTARKATWAGRRLFRRRGK